MELVRPRMGHFKAVMAADRDFESAGEEPYCGSRGRMGYFGWLAVGAYAAMALDECTRAVFMFLRWNSGCWKNKNLLYQSEE